VIPQFTEMNVTFDRPVSLVPRTTTGDR
jgi:hypothetical protein